MEWLGIAPPKGASAQANPKLSDIANVINGIENPKAEKANSMDLQIHFFRAAHFGNVSGVAEAARDFVTLQGSLGVSPWSAYKTNACLEDGRYGKPGIAVCDTEWGLPTRPFGEGVLIATRIENLVDLVNRPAESFISMGAEPSVIPDPSVAQPKYTRLVEILHGGTDGEPEESGRHPLCHGATAESDLQSDPPGDCRGGAE